MTALIIFNKTEVMWQFFQKRGYPVSVAQAGHHSAKKIDRQSALQMVQKENIGIIPFTLKFTLTIKQLNPSFLETLKYFKKIPKLVVSFRSLL